MFLRVQCLYYSFFRLLKHKNQNLGTIFTTFTYVPNRLTQCITTWDFLIIFDSDFPSYTLMSISHHLVVKTQDTIIWFVHTSHITSQSINPQHTNIQIFKLSRLMSITHHSVVSTQDTMFRFAHTYHITSQSINP